MATNEMLSALAQTLEPPLGCVAGICLRKREVDFTSVIAVTYTGAAETDDLSYSISRVERSIADWEARGRFRYEPMFRARIMTLMAPAVISS
jgi:hypothetical protein